jgi:hypothetical protein
MKRVKLAGGIGLALVVALAISATAAASTGWQFKAAEYPVTSTSANTNFHGFEIAGATSVCKKAEFKSGEEGAPNPAGPQATLEVHPKYSECEILLSGVAKAVVNTTGCNYVFHVATPRTKEGTTDIKCTGGHKIEVVDEGITGCVIEVPEQTGIKGIEYVNEQPKDKVNAEVSNITYKSSSACSLVVKEGTNGIYREGEFVAGTPKLAAAGKPATALSEGLTSLSAPDLVSVSQGSGNASAVHWQVNGKKLAVGTVQPTIGWGTVTLASSAGNITCKSAQAGNLANEASTEAHSEVVALTTYECKPTGGECAAPAEERAGGLNLAPGAWGSFMIEKGPIEGTEAFRSEVSTPPANQINVAVECTQNKAPELPNLVFVSGPKTTGPEGTATPRWLNGTTATKPSEVSFDTEAGHLQAEGPVEEPKEAETATETETVSGSATIKDKGTATWGAKVKAGCRIKSSATRLADTVKAVINTKEIELGNAVSEGKAPATVTGTEAGEFKCGPLVTKAIEGTTTGKVKTVGYLDNGTTPLITLGPNAAP